jgi:hypothetical protein
MPVLTGQGRSLTSCSGRFDFFGFFYKEQIEKMSPLGGELSLPGWDSSYKKEDLKDLCLKSIQSLPRRIVGELKIFSVGNYTCCRGSRK